MLGAIGDFLVTTPTMAALARQFPDARLTVIIRRQIAELAIHISSINEVITYDQSNPFTKVKFLFRLQQQRFDLWVDLHAPTPNTVCSNHRVFMRNAFLLHFPRARYRLGFSVPWLRHFLTHGVPVPDEKTLRSENIVDTTLRLADTAPCHLRKKELAVADHHRSWAGSFLRAVGCEGAPLIGFFFGSKQPSDTWPIENVVAFCNELRTAFPSYAFLLIGGPAEAPVAGQMELNGISHCSPPFVNCIGKTSLMQTAALLERCSVFVTTDSGPMHIADAIGTPIVALFSNKNFRSIWEPLTEKKKVLQVMEPCGPCFSDTCPNNNRCMRSITPDEVISAVRDLL